ncbi:related to bifunctional 4-hydroxyphenylacetate degradation enzyme [Claviceps purpurea 20.1]|uniref:Related to bifunctional 4-hydroxyphenylacetate degradation enzyme n=1 Tax=Claviceps purpurea (strain 20.1) TaxID=1111077 RepID=M1W0H3_CLAP2|nr:related to bifunctional 4-hydroxyphenylacetate degradation enzyme [Claviceps purpurea 20.1]
MAPNWTRLIRFIAHEDGQVHLGEVIPTEHADVGLAAVDGPKVFAKAITGSVFDGVVTSRTLTVESLLCPISASEVPLIRCMGLNYRDHALEANLPIPDVPVLFIKPRTALSGPYPAAIPIPRLAQDGTSDYEAELCFVMGKSGRDIPEEHAMEYVLGFTAGNDGKTLERGTVVMTGTGPGVGAMRTPKVTLKHGDDIYVEIENIGTKLAFEFWTAYANGHEAQIERRDLSSLRSALAMLDAKIPGDKLLGPLAPIKAMTLGSSIALYLCRNRLTCGYLEVLLDPAITALSKNHTTEFKVLVQEVGCEGRYCNDWITLEMQSVFNPRHFPALFHDSVEKNTAIYAGDNLIVYVADLEWALEVNVRRATRALLRGKNPILELPDAAALIHQVRFEGEQPPLTFEYVRGLAARMSDSAPSDDQLQVIADFYFKIYGRVGLTRTAVEWDEGVRDWKPVEASDAAEPE